MDYLKTSCPRSGAPGFEQYLKSGITAQSLEQTAMTRTDTQAAQALQDMRRDLFNALQRKRA